MTHGIAAFFMRVPRSWLHVTVCVSREQSPDMKYLVVLALLVASIAAMPQQCTADADCVPATCCHSTICVNKQDRPTDCANKVCSDPVCAPYTLDCGGTCGCNAATKQCEGTLMKNHHEDTTVQHGKAAKGDKIRRYGYIHVRVKGPYAGHHHAGEEAPTK
jgi:hypothetical protein